jgi:radical SAM protein with 4Fe4S-binding SPASM domain
MLDFVNKRRINFHIHLSLDGLGGLHDRIRGVEGNFEKTDYLAHELKKYRSSLFDFHVGCTLSGLNYFALEDIHKYAKGLGVPLRVQVYEHADYFDNANNTIPPFQANLSEALKALGHNPYYKICQHALRTGRHMRFSCYALFTFFAIRCNGDVVTCMRKYWNHSVGNLREKSFTKIWSGAKASQARGIVKRCSGCLDACEVTWSLSSCYFFLFKTMLEKDV